MSKYSTSIFATCRTCGNVYNRKTCQYRRRLFLHTQCPPCTLIDKAALHHSLMESPNHQPYSEASAVNIRDDVEYFQIGFCGRCPNKARCMSMGLEVSVYLDK